MAASRGMLALLALLLYCWQEAELQHLRALAASSPELPPSLRNLDDDLATVFDEILVQEMLDHSKSSASITQATEATLSTRLFKEKEAGTKISLLAGTHKKHQVKQFSSGKEDRLPSDEKEKERLFQIKSLAALENIIDHLRSALAGPADTSRGREGGQWSLSLLQVYQPVLHQPIPAAPDTDVKGGFGKSQLPGTRVLLQENDKVSRDTLKQRNKHKSLSKGAKHHKRKQSLTETAGPPEGPHSLPPPGRKYNRSTDPSV
uniref:Uncharacterized protein n=1 Tax=Equus caballus TaxID=9796 RepID=A0A3Q2HFD6_HORSE